MAESRDLMLAFERSEKQLEKDFLRSHSLRTVVTHWIRWTQLSCARTAVWTMLVLFAL
jgi:hypothetical protein